MKVMISSTVKDLVDLRDRLYDYLKEKGHEPWISGKPGFPTHLDNDAMTCCVKAAESSDYFILILDRHSGLTYKKTGTSITEAEFNAASNSNKPRSIFVREPVDSQCKIFRQMSEDQRKDIKWDCDHGVYDFYDRLQHLENVPWRHLFSDYNNIIENLKADFQKFERRKILLDKSFTPHPYHEDPHFTGRTTERKMLNDWLIRDKDKPLLSLVGIGGMGKSALAWRWLQEEIIDKGMEFDGIVWWSFYEKEMTFSSFIRSFIIHKWGEKSPLLQMATSEQINKVFEEFQKNNYLIILDGVERILKAYFGLGSPYQKDDDKTLSSDKDFRACIDPSAGNFLQKLASDSVKSKTLLTTRLHPKALDTTAGCLRYNLTSFSREDGEEFFRRQGVKGTRAEIERECEKYGFHPLSLRLLSGMIVSDPECKGDIAKCEILGRIEDMAPKEHNILELSYNALDDEKKEFVSSLAAFRSPMDFEAIKSIAKYENHKELISALIEVVNRGILFQRKEKDKKGKEITIYDLHPIVRSYCYVRLRDKEGVHSQLRDYFASVPEPEKIESIDDLAPVIELYHHTVRAGRYEEAIKLYKDRLSSPLYFMSGSYQTQIELLSAIFPEDYDKPPKDLREDNIAWALNSLANSYSISGQPRRAVLMFEMIKKIDIKNLQNQDARFIFTDDRFVIPKDHTMSTNYLEQCAISLGNLAEDQLKIGDLESVEYNLQRAINICEEIDEERYKAMWQEILGKNFAYIGNFIDSAKELDIAFEIQKRYNAPQGQCIVTISRSLRALLMDDPKEALKCAQQALEFAKKEEKERGEPTIRDFIRANWLIGASYVAMGKVEEAEAPFQFAITECRKINMVDHEAPILLELAKLRHLQQKDNESLPLATEALEIANRCGYVLQQADIHFFLAQYYKDLGDLAKAHEHAELAKLRSHQMIDVKTGDYITKPEDTKWMYRPCYDKAVKMLVELEA